jgi:hypothetical protein
VRSLSPSIALEETALSCQTLRHTYESPYKPATTNCVLFFFFLLSTELLMPLFKGEDTRKAPYKATWCFHEGIWRCGNTFQVAFTHSYFHLCLMVILMFFFFVYLTDRPFFGTQCVPGNAIVNRIVFSYRRSGIRSRLRAVQKLRELGNCSCAKYEPF